ncbi:MAG TPA: hypothetical protein VN025_00875 [Candidatus Dormibacteraeota bacterium]|jgi:hypothetical protein|nr:hypothetical protein [Candidatus Dormibacteraeota bacterium]
MRLLRIFSIFLVCASVALGQQQWPVTSIVNEPTIAGRAVQLDAQGKLLPWPMADDTGFSYSSHFMTQWTILWDQYNRQRLPYFYCCFDFDRTTFEMFPELHWVNSTGYLRAMMQGFVERLYAYTGDPRTIEMLQNFMDYELENGLTPESYSWAGVPYPSANPGAKRYTGWSQHGEDFVEPHVVGEDGYAYLRLYEMTGNTRYLREAIRCAEMLAKHFKPGDEKNSPWPFRCFARDGSLEGGKGMSPYTANVAEPIMLFDELIRLEQGDVVTYKRVREGAWSWLMKYPMTNNVWVGYFEDVGPGMENMNQVIPLELARYVLLHPEKDPDWREHARKLIEWVKTTPKWPKYIVHGATVTTEQGDGKSFCCNLPNQCCESHTSRLAAVEAFYYAKTSDAAYKEAAYRSYNWVTYFQGLPGGAHAPYTDQWWFTDEFTDGPRRLMDALWAVPEWAPAEESHLLGGLSPVTKISYEQGSVVYSTFDADATEVLRLDFTPEFVTANGKPVTKRMDLSQTGYTFDEKTHVMRVRHENARDIAIQGTSGNVPPRIVTFDDPHLTAGTVLDGFYPTAPIAWGDSQWVIAVPSGKFGTFHLTLKDPAAENANIWFSVPQIFAGIDIFNGAPNDAIVNISSPETRAVKVTLKPGELKRVRTGWRDPSSQILFQFQRGEGLQFDNLAWIHN